MTGAGEARGQTFHPLTSERWDDLESLFGERGACGGCWCMWYRLPRREFEAGKGDVNRRRLRLLTEERPPGILAYEGALAVGWCSIAPRTDYLRLERARTMGPVDDLPVWSILCLFVRPSHRRRGASIGLIRAAARYALERGAPAVEAYPLRSRKSEVPPVFASQGLLSAYCEAGFREVARPTESRSIVRYPAGRPR